MKKILQLLTYILFYISIINLYSQDYPGSTNKMGLTASINTSQFSILIPYFTNYNFSIAPGVELKYAQSMGVDLGLGLTVKSFFKPISSVFPYFGLKGGVIYFFPAPDNMDIQKDYFTGIVLGTEYFFSPQFSLGIEPQLNLTFSDDNSNRFGNPGKMNINTATMITTNIYF